MARTTVTDTIYAPDGTPISGTIFISANSQFTSADGEQIYESPVVVTIDNDGVFSVDLSPNDTATPSGTSYSARYSLDGPPGYSGQVPEETWVVPTSASPVGLGSVRTSPAPSPGVSGYITSLNGLTTVSQLFARSNDTNVTLTITSTTATHTFALGWTGTTSATRGGTGLNTSAATGVPKVTTGTWSVDAAAQDLNGWPSGVTNTEVGYLDGVTSAIQTQLDSKLPKTGGTVNDPTPVTGNTQLIIKNGEGQSQAPTQWQDSSGVTQTAVLATGEVWRLSGGSVKVQLGTSVDVSSDGLFRFYNGTNIFGAAVDTAMSRASSGVVEVNNGTPGTLRDLKSRYVVQSGTSSSDSSMDESQFMLILTSNTNLQIRAKGSDGVVRTANVVLA